MAERRTIPEAKRLTIMLHSHDHSHHHSLATEILRRARRAHLAGATMLAAVEGQGHSGEVHRQHLFSDDVPLSIMIVDEAAKVTAFADEIRDLVGSSVVHVEPVTAFRV
jgi:hypothetical protein